MSLSKYKKKRNFSVSPEPTAIIKKKSDALSFVVQRHKATRLHYDFRLEMNGVLKSWAVPKGPSTNPQDKRLAIETEDHPMDYATFEGVIPEDEYGAGPVIVWDTGTFTNLKENGYKNGHIEVTLDGTKLHGNYALI